MTAISVISQSLRHADPELVVVGDIVVGGEEIGVGELCGGETHELGITGPVRAIEPGIAQGSDDLDASRTLDLDRTTVETGIIDPHTLAGIEGIGTHEHTIDGDGDGGGEGVDIGEA